MSEEKSSSNKELLAAPKAKTGGLGFGSYIGMFFAVFLAICVGVALFTPEKLPSGIGLSPVPMQVELRASLIGEGKVATIINLSDKTLHNVKLTCVNKQTGETKTYSYETWAPKEIKEIGWAEGWKWLSGEALIITASGFSPRTWSCH